MASAERFEHAIAVGRRTRRAAGAVGDSFFPRWRQRAFRRHLGRFIVALQNVPQREAETLTRANLSALSSVVDGIVTEADAFMAEHHDVTTAVVEQDRFVVTELYQLRAIVETLTRHVTADPAFTDVAWSVRTESANRTKP